MKAHLTRITGPWPPFTSTPSIYSVSAEDAVTISGAAGAGRDLVCEASDTILISPVAAASRVVYATSSSDVTFATDAGESVHSPEGFSVNAVNTVNISGEAISMADFPKSGVAGVTISGSASALVGHTYTVSAEDEVTFDDESVEGFYGRAATSFSVTGLAGGRVVHTYSKSASGSFYMHGNLATAKLNPIRVAATTGIRVLGQGRTDDATNFTVHAADTIEVSADAAEADTYHRLLGVATTALAMHGVAGEVASFRRPATSAVHVTAQEGGGRAIRVAAVTALALSEGSNPRGQFHGDAAQGVFSVAGQSFSGIGSRRATGGITLGSAADARNSAGSGPGTVLLSGTSGDYPMSFAETPSGLILIADGIDPMIRWDGLAAIAAEAGLRPPSSPIALGGMNVGTISGRRVAYCRFIDSFGNRSCLSPVSNEVDFGRDALIDSITIGVSSAVTVRSEAHGLVTGDAIVIGGVEGMDNLNGTRVVTVLDEDTFTLDGVVSSGAYRGGAWWVWGIESVVYQNVPVSADPKVVRRQLLRNLAGDSSTLYVDIDTEDLTSTALASTSDDEALAQGEPVALFFDDDLPAANRYGVPPSHKSVVASHLGRIFATADVTYREGSCSVVYGSLEIGGIATDWRETFIGRLIYPAGATRSYEIAGVDEAAQVITLSSAYADATSKFCTYAIRSAPGERKLVYYSEPSLPEAWPPWNAISVPEDSDEVVGMLVKGSFLYVLERRHIYRFTFQADPAQDGFLFLSTGRGCVNNRCHVQVEDATYMLDDVGIHAFDGGQSSTPVSGPIQNLFQLDGAGGLQVDWAADQTLWHAAHDPVRDTIRWFVHFVGDADPVHALCYDYRLQRWWIEAYPAAITASAVGTIGYRRSLVGTTGRRVLCLSEGALDGVEPQAGLRGTATGGTTTTLADSAGLFPDGLADAPVAITDGTLKGQVRVIASATGTELTVVEPWDGTPDATTQYQIGGVPWSWRSGWFSQADDESDNPRDVELVFQPLGTPTTADLALYYDHDETPKVWKYTRSQDGLATEDGSPYVSVNLATRGGYVQHRLTGHSDRYALGEQYVQVGLSGVQAGEVVRVFGIGLNGAKGGE